MNKKHLLVACGLLLLPFGAFADFSLDAADDDQNQQRSMDISSGDPQDDDERLIGQLSGGFASYTRAVCKGSIPKGWIVVDKASTMVCGIDGVGSAAGFAEVIPIIAQYSNKPVGTIMQVCYGTVPKGWKKISEGHSSWLCGGHPTDFPLTSGVSNVMTIKKKKPKA